MATKRVNFTIEEELLKRLDDEASRLGVTRSSYIAQSVNKNLLEAQTVDLFKDNPQVFEETLKRMLEGMNK